MISVAVGKPAVVAIVAVPEVPTTNVAAATLVIDGDSLIVSVKLCVASAVVPFLAVAEIVML